MSKKYLLIIDANDTEESSHDMTFQHRVIEGSHKKEVYLKRKKGRRKKRGKWRRGEKWRMLITIDVVFSLLNFHAFQSTDRKFSPRSLSFPLRFSFAAAIPNLLIIKKHFLQRTELELESFEKFLMFFIECFIVETQSRAGGGSVRGEDNYFLMIYTQILS